MNSAFAGTSFTTSTTWAARNCFRKVNKSRFASVFVVVIQSLSHIQLFVTPWTAACQAFLSFTISRRLLKLMSIELVMPSNLLSSVVPFFSHLQSFPGSGSFQMSWPFASGGQCWSFSFSISPSNQYSGLIPFRID